MEFLVLIGIIWAVVSLISWLSDKSRRVQPTPRPGAPSEPTVATKDRVNTYRPTSSGRRSPVEWSNWVDASGGESFSPSDLDIKDLVDALTGAPLLASVGLHQCRRCKVFYQDRSVEVIRAENGGRCVSCLHAEIVSVGGQREHRGRNADVDVVTLDTYRSYVGHVITFEGNVHTVLTSRRGTDHAVMFENRPWTRGFKMVVFRRAVDVVGGERFLYSLVGHRVRVRGLLVKHETFGYEIIVSDRAMILAVL